MMVAIEHDSPFRRMANHGGYVMEHRLTVAKSLGRCLDRAETVHHIDGNPLNNEISNLQLRTGLHGKGVVMTCRDCGSQHIGFEKLK